MGRVSRKRLDRGPRNGTNCRPVRLRSRARASILRYWSSKRSGSWCWAVPAGSPPCAKRKRSLIVRSVCDNCDSVWSEDELDKIRDLGQRVQPGGVMPSGDCPDCGALCYLDVAVSPKIGGKLAAE